MSTAVSTDHGTTGRRAKEPHRSVSGGAPRAAVFGMSDGLVTNASLILGLAGAHPTAGVVELAGLAGLVAGACSMAVGEYVSMQAQRELLLREIAVERREIQRFPEAEHRELASLYQQRGLAPDLAWRVAGDLMRDEDLAVETHAREELGIDTGDLGSPGAAAAASFVSFAVGAAVPLAPWLFGGGATALVLTVVLASTMSFVVGAVLGKVTDRAWLRAGLRQLGLSAMATGVVFVVGLAAGHAGLR